MGIDTEKETYIRSWPGWLLPKSRCEAILFPTTAEPPYRATFPYKLDEGFLEEVGRVSDEWGGIPHEIFGMFVYSWLDEVFSPCSERVSDEIEAQKMPNQLLKILGLVQILDPKKFSYREAIAGVHSQIHQELRFVHDDFRPEIVRQTFRYLGHSFPEIIVSPNLPTNVKFEARDFEAAFYHYLVYDGSSHFLDVNDISAYEEGQAQFWRQLVSKQLQTAANWGQLPYRC